MALIDLKSRLSELKYGKDKPGGGNSNPPQPFIRISPPNGRFAKSPDFLLRNGFLNPVSVGLDVARISQFFLSPEGFLFIGKQLALSKTDVKTQTSNLRKKYLPLNTLGQIGASSIGLHLDRDIGEELRYSNVVKYSQPTDQNRLVEFFNDHITVEDNSVNLYSYDGGPGPGSNAGFGKTNIKIVSPEQRTGVNNPKFGLVFLPNQQLPKTEGLGATKLFNKSDIEFSDVFLVRKKYQSNITENPVLGKASTDKPNNNQVYTKDSDGSLSLDKQALDPDRQPKQGLPKFTPKPNTYDPINGKTSRVNYSRSPGEKNPDGLNSFNYSATDRPPLDKINSEPIYRSTDTKPRAGNTLNDFVNFRIAVINNTDPTIKDFIHFRAFLNTFTDNYTAQWDGVNYPGRGEKFYRYGGFDRKFSTSWTVYAQSKAELIPMYQKLNFLASTLAPDYGTNGFMKGNLVQLTLGGYLYEQPGVITSLTYTAPEDSPYETAINDDGVDESVKQLPFRINVSSFEFIPIHEFRPERQGTQLDNKRFIALSDGSTTNY
jgi:hypothetical protein